MHVDGFRFDLASILTRGVDGKPMEHPPIIEKISKDPLLKTKKLIAEAWDANSLYQLGAFPKWGKWSEWNGYYRDQVRRFIKGTDDQAGPFASAIAGSDTLYRKSKTPLSSINFITAHDGFSLRDLVSYQDKHNWENGENNQDGNSQNDNWNCGIEGKTNDPKIKALRERQMRNFLLALFISQGTPMILMGDEYGHTRKGNNNPYVQDNEINWFLWDQMDVKIVHFVSSLITFRQKHPCLKKETFLTDADIKWFNNWDASSRFVSFCLEKTIYCAFNADFEKIHIALPEGKWKTVVYTKEDWIFHTDGAPISSIELEPYSALVAIAIP
jgi:isoamylase